MEEVVYYQCAHCKEHTAVDWGDWDGGPENGGGIVLRCEKCGKDSYV